jgi:mannose-6-phosphate isomerase-like protein (cupin superfamily)
VASPGEEDGLSPRREAPSPQPAPINLTEVAGRMPWAAVHDALQVGGPAAGAAIQIRGLAPGDEGQVNDGGFDVVYVLASGYGRLCARDRCIDCTAGDIMFVPRGWPHHFERLDGEMCIWRITAVAP